MTSKEKCVAVSSCLWAENQYGSYTEWQCLFFNTTELMEKFCKLYDKMTNFTIRVNYYLPHVFCCIMLLGP